MSFDQLIKLRAPAYSWRAAVQCKIQHSRQADRKIGNFVYSIVSANIDQSVPKLATVYIAIKSQMSLIMGQIESENPELFALEFGKIAESDFVYTPASTNIDQSISNLVKMYMTIRSRMSLIMDLMGSELSKLSTLELENFLYLTLFTL